MTHPIRDSCQLRKGDGKTMKSYVVLAAVFRFAVDFLLLMAADHYARRECSLLRLVLGAAVGGIHTVLATMPYFTVLGNDFWRVFSSVVMCAISFGIQKDGMKIGIFFVLLRISLDGLIVHTGGLEDIIWASLFLGLCLYGFRGRTRQKQLIPVELTYGDQHIRFQALWDTGNTLKDPVTGNSVLVVDRDIADRLTGLTVQQLEKPVETMGVIPGLRLIPYSSVGQSRAMLLGIFVKQSRIGRRKGSTVVAFAPQILDEKGVYQGLLGD